MYKDRLINGICGHQGGLAWHMVGCLADELSGRLGRGSDGRANGWLFYYMAYSGHGRMDSALVVCRFGVLAGG